MDQELAEKTVEQLKGASIDFVTYLPETRLSRILPILEKDNFFTRATSDMRGRWRSISREIC